MVQSGTDKKHPGDVADGDVSMAHLCCERPAKVVEHDFELLLRHDYAAGVVQGLPLSDG